MTSRRYRDTPPASTVPAYDRLVADGAGRLWVRHYVPPWQEAQTWRVFDADGRWLQDVSLPTGLDVIEIGADYVLGTRTDELGIEYVELYGMNAGDA